MPTIYKAYQASEAWQREGVKREAVRLKAEFSAIPIHADKAQLCEGDQYWLDMATSYVRVQLMLMSQPKSGETRKGTPVYPRKSLRAWLPEDRWRLVEDEAPYFVAIDGGAARTASTSSTPPDPSSAEKPRLSLAWISGRCPASPT